MAPLPSPTGQLAVPFTNTPNPNQSQVMSGQGSGLNPSATTQQGIKSNVPPKEPLFQLENPLGIPKAEAQSPMDQQAPQQQFLGPGQDPTFTKMWDQAQKDNQHPEAVLQNVLGGNPNPQVKGFIKDYMTGYFQHNPNGTPYDAANSALNILAYGTPDHSLPKPPVGLADHLLPAGQEFMTKAGDALGRMASGQQGIMHTAFQVTGADAGALNSSIGAGVGAVAQGAWNVAPEAIKKPLGDAAQSLLQTPIVQSGLHAISQGKDMYDQWAKANPGPAADLESAVNIGMLLPVDKTLGAAGDAAKSLLYKTGLPEAASDALRTSAEDSVQKALGATTKALKTVSGKITPEILDRPMSDTFALTRAGMEKKAAAGVEKAGQAIEEFGALNGSTPTQKIVDALEAEKKPFMAGGKVINQAAVQHLTEMQQLFSQYGKTVDNETLRDALRIVSKQVAGKSGNGFATSLEDGSRIDAMKTASNVVRGIIADAHPDLAKLNKDFSFWKNFQKVISATNTRTAGQTGFMEKAGGAIGAVVGSHAGTKGAVEGFAIGKYLTSVLQSPAWRLVSARVKNNIADAIGYGDEEALKEALDSATVGKPDFEQFKTTDSPTPSTQSQLSPESEASNTTSLATVPPTGQGSQVSPKKVKTNKSPKIKNGRQ